MALLWLILPAAGNMWHPHARICNVCFFTDASYIRHQVINVHLTTTVPLFFYETFQEVKC